MGSGRGLGLGVDRVHIRGMAGGLPTVPVWARLGSGQPYRARAVQGGLATGGWCHRTPSLPAAVWGAL